MKDNKGGSPSDTGQSKEYEDLNLRAKRLSEKLKRLSTEEMEKEAVNKPNDQQSKEVKEILRRYSGILGRNNLKYISSYHIFVVMLQYTIKSFWS